MSIAPPIKKTPFMLRGLYDPDNDGSVGLADVAASTNAIKGVTVNDAALADGKVLAYDLASTSLVYVTPGGGSAGTPSDTNLGQPPDFTAPHRYDSVGIGTTYSDSYTKKSCQLTVDIAQLETVYGASGWELYVMFSGSLNNAGSLLCEVYNETDSASLGEVTSTFSGTGTGTIEPKAIGPFNTSLPSSGVKRLRVHWKKSAAATATVCYFRGPWTLIARKA